MTIMIMICSQLLDLVSLFCTPTLSMSRRTSTSALLHTACTSASSSAGSSMGVGNELSNYLDSDNISHIDNKFNIIS
jgi:hypothetical protein